MRCHEARRLKAPNGGTPRSQELLRFQPRGSEALGTDYRYFMNVSLSYAFGSVFSSIVNPGFD